MKKKIILLAIMAFATVTQMVAREFETGEKLYFNGTPSNFSTWKNDAELWGQFISGSDNYWIQAKWTGDLPYFEIPAAAARDWSTIRLARCQIGTNHSNIYNQTGEISFYENKNYIENFCYGDGWKDAYWGSYVPYPEGNPADWSLVAEDVQLCTSAAGKTFNLAPKNYDDSSNTDNNAWFHFNGSTWDCLQNAGFNVNAKSHPIILVANSDDYYFYQCSKPSMRRLMRIRLNVDCSEGAEGACAITSFIGVASGANVTDQTSAIDGLVAFEDKTNAGDLMIWCPGVDTMTIANSDLDMPQVFKLTGFDASSTKTYTLYTKFLSGTGCDKTCNVTVNPPTAEVKTHETTGTTGDLSLTRFTEESVTLTPDNQSSTSYSWTNDYNDEKYTEADGIRNRTFTGPAEQTTINYVFLAADDPEAPEGNLIVNGNFEHNGDFTSDYEYWGDNPKDYYTTADVEHRSGGYALSKNSHYFSESFNEVEAHNGEYFGLFDSKVTFDEQTAWRTTSAQNPKLKVQAGVSYLFSFWVANINKEDEMHNCARLQFQISYEGGLDGTWNDLGGEINLNDFKDNRWHGLSSIATPTISSDNVALRVINNNKNGIDKMGNDFALDDIRFAAVTSRSSNVSGYEIFPVKYLKCVIKDATIVLPQVSSCGATTANVICVVEYENPRGDLYVYEGSTLLAKVLNADLDGPTSHTVTLVNQPADNADHALTIYFDDGAVKTDAPQTYSYHAWAVPQISVESVSWNHPDCDVTTATLTAVVKYTNQNGMLSVNVDGVVSATEPISYSSEVNEEKSVTITIPGVVADGKTGHKLNVSFGGSHGCDITDYVISEAAPFSPKISNIVAKPKQMLCDVTTYDVDVTFEVANGQDKEVTISGKGQTKTIEHVAEGTNSVSFTGIAVDDEADQFEIWFADATDCTTHKVATYTEPTTPSISVATPLFSAMDCDKTTYTLSAVVTYTNQNGKLYAWIDDGAKVEFPFTANQATSATTTITFDGLTADGKTHKLNIEFDGDHGCSKAGTEATDFTAPFAPTITAVTATPQEMKCGEAEYKVNVTATLSDNAIGKTLTISGDKDGTYTITNTSFSEEITVSQSTATGSFSLSFADADNCTVPVTATYTVPTAPALAVNTITVPTPVCDQTTFDLHVTGTFGTLHGTRLEFYWGGLLKETLTDLSTGTIDVTLKDLIYDGVTRDVEVKTENDDDCNFTQSLVVPFASEITSYSATVQPYACGDTQYSVKVEATFENGQGKNLIIEDWNGNKQPVATLATDTKAEYPFSYDWETPATHEYKIYFEGTEAICSESHKVSFTSPAKPEISVGTPLFSAMDCDKTTYTLSAVVTYTNQNGKLYAWIDDGAKVEFPFTANQATSATTTITFDGLTADGKTHKLNIEFDGDHGCSKAGTEATDFTAPFAPTITAVTATPQEMKCGEAEYKVNVTATLSDNAIGKTLTISGDKDGTYTITNTSFSEEITVSQSTATGSFSLSFADADNCTVPVTATYTVPTAPALAVNTITVPTPVCDQTTFDLHVTGTFGTLHGTRLEFYWGGLLKETLTDLSTGTIDVTLKDLIYDGVTRDVEVKTENDDDCNFTQSLVVPFSPKVNSMSVSGVPATLPCGTTSYNATVAVDYENGDGKNIVIEYTDGGATKTQTVATADLPATLALTDLNNGSHNIRVWFEGVGSCASEPSHQVSYNAPANATITGGFAVNTTDIKCGETEYAVSGSIVFDVALGDLVVKYDDAHQQTISSPTSPQAFTIAGMTDQKKNMTLEAYFTGNPLCPAISAIFDAPAIPVFNSVTLTQPAQLSCGQTTYPVNFEIDTDGQEGILQVLDENGNVVYSHNNPAPGLKDHFNVAADRNAHNLTFRFTGPDDCEKTASYIALGTPTLTCTEKSRNKVACGDTDYTITFTVEYTNQTTQITLRDALGTVYDQWLPVDEDDQRDIVVTRPLTADGTDNLILECASAGEGIEPCVVNVPITGLAQQHGISAFTLGTPAYTDACETKYEIPFNISYTGLTGNLIIADANQGDKIVWQGNAADGKMSGLDATAGVETMNLHAWFADNTECVTDIQAVNSLVLPTLAVTKAGERTIDYKNKTFTETVRIEFTNQDGKTLYIAANGTELTHYDAPVTSPVDYTYSGVADGKAVTLDIYFGNPTCAKQYAVVAQTEPTITYNGDVKTNPDCNSLFVLTISVDVANTDANLVVREKGGAVLTADNGKYSYTAKADGQVHYFEMYFDNKPEETWDYPEGITFPAEPDLTFVSSSVSALDKDTMYVPAIFFTSVNLTGTPMIADEQGNVITPTSATATSFVLPAVKADGKEHKGKIYDSACPLISADYTYQSPAVPTLEITSAITAQNCDGTYDATFTFTYANQEGNLVVADIDGKPLQVTDNQLKIHEPADGNRYTVNVWFDGGAQRISTAWIDAPAIGVVNTLTTDTAAIRCNDNTYTLTVRGSVTNPNSDLIIECDGVQRAERSQALLLANPDFTATITDLNMDAPVAKVRAYFKERPSTDCYKEVDALHNVKRNCIEVGPLSLCQGSDYKQYGFNLTDLQTDVVNAQVADTILNIHVVPQPTLTVQDAGRVCNSETVLSFTYTDTGESDRYSVAFSDNQFADVINAVLTDDVINIALPAGVKPGKYTAEVTIGHHEAGCTTSATAQFEISATDMLYSKWDDVLLVPNRDGDVKAYQWYHNGERMDGETQQRLYNPADKTGSFYCEVTMEDGTVFTTCEGEFAQEPFSREQNTVTPTQTQADMPIAIHRATDGPAQIGVYTVTGQQIAVYETLDTDITIKSPNSSGVYVIMISTSDTNWTQKIVVK